MNIINKGCQKIKSALFTSSLKYDSELAFKKEIIQQIIEWYRGDIQSLYNTPAPDESQRIKVGCEQDNAILTYSKLHQEPTYLETLRAAKEDFSGTRLLDIGSSAVPSALVFENAEVFCLDPLLDQQLHLGYPFWAYDARSRFIYGFAEHMPFPDNFFDAAISVNALDHVDDFMKTAQEIQRVTRPGAKLRFHIHYHPATKTEPLSLDDNKVRDAFKWSDNFKKVASFNSRHGATLPDGELHTVWSTYE